MLQANLPESLWGEAINTATYLRNRCASKCLDGITPYEAWTQRKPYVGFFRTIGSKTIALNKGQRRKNFQPKGDEYILVGYSEESKAYRLWKPGTKTVIKARDVKFFERIEPPIDVPSKEILTIPNKIAMIDEGNPDQNEENSDDEDNSSELHDDSSKNETEENSLEDPQINEQENNEPRRGAGRPKIIRTGKPGRPQKVYQPKRVQQSDPKSVPQMLEQDDKEA